MLLSADGREAAGQAGERDEELPGGGPWHEWFYGIRRVPVPHPQRDQERFQLATVQWKVVGAQAAR